MNFFREAWAKASSNPVAIEDNAMPTGIDPGMSYCRDEGKDKIIFMSKDEELTPLSKEVKETLNVPLEMEGPIKPSGEINWNCPCMAGMVSGPCGYAFRQAFSCFHHSKDEPPSEDFPDGKPKGAECGEAFRSMSECMSRYPRVYGKARDDDDEDDLLAMDQDQSDKPS